MLIEGSAVIGVRIRQRSDVPYDIDKINAGLRQLQRGLSATAAATFEAGEAFGDFVASARKAFGLPPAHYNPLPRFGLRPRRSLVTCDHSRRQIDDNRCSAVVAPVVLTLDLEDTDGAHQNNRAVVFPREAAAPDNRRPHNHRLEHHQARLAVEARQLGVEVNR